MEKMNPGPCIKQLCPMPVRSGCFYALPCILSAFLLLGGLFLHAQPAVAKVIHVPEHYQALQDAVQSASTGDTVVVAPGTYRLFFDNLQVDIEQIVIKSTAGAAETIITGRGSGPVITIAQQSRAVIQGFTITRETDSDLIHSLGGAIYCSAGSAPVIRNNIIMNNRAVFGAGIYCDTQSTPDIRNNVFSGNRAETSGGAIFTEHSRAVINGNLFEHNSAGSSGGALACNRDSSRIYGNIFWQNSADYGGAISCDRAAGWIYNNTLVANSARRGAGIMVDRGSVRLLNLIFYSNSRGDIFFKGTGPAGRPMFSNLQESGFAGMNGNVSTDPMFVSPDTGDFRLRPGSPCIDTGSHDPFYRDMDGSYNDMGAYGGPEPFEDRAGTDVRSGNQLKSLN
jgi:predicted outer membrane repeat protein